MLHGNGTIGAMIVVTVSLTLREVERLCAARSGCVLVFFSRSSAHIQSVFSVIRAFIPQPYWLSDVSAQKCVIVKNCFAW